MKKPRVAFVTGTRADFGKLSPLISTVQTNGSFEYDIIATGMHMMSAFGYTFNQIVKAGYENIFPIFNQSSGTTHRMDLALATTITLFSHYVHERKPDLIVIHGDRIEALAAVIVGNLNNIKVAHIEGGEVSGTVDECLRHSISKLATIHLVANETAKCRLLQLGEEENSVFVIGSPEVDVMIGDSLPSIDEVRARYEIPFSSYAIMIYHPVVTELDRMSKHADEVFAATEEANINFVVIRPNNDTGCEIINSRIDSSSAGERFRVLPSVRFEYFLTLLREARFIIGNSSSGIREAPVYGVPTINIGSRQLNRFQYEGIVNVPEDRNAILSKIKACPQRVASVRPFGDGKSAERFLAILCSDDIWRAPMQKHFVDRPLRPKHRR
jgi:UDP-N-acetylglucosamine 2-epimerase (hydrolysing)